MSLQSPWKDLLAEPLPRDHVVQLYREDRFLVESVTLFAGVGIGKGEGIVLVATAPHLAAIEQRLTALGFEVDALRMWRQLTTFDAGRLLCGFMVDGAPDAALFKTVVGQIINDARAGGRYPRLRVYGEMVELLWRDNRPATRRLEELWGEVIEQHSISLLCGYSLESDAEARQFPDELRTAHSHVVPLEACARTCAPSATLPDAAGQAAQLYERALVTPPYRRDEAPRPAE